METRFPDGVFFIPLAALEYPEGIIPAIGKATGFQFYEGKDPKRQILDYLRRKRMLLVMDNFEHLVSGAPLLTEIVEAAPDVKILVTSREKLNLRYEVPYILRGMRYPEDGEMDIVEEPFSAIELFLQRTKRIQSAFVPNDEEIKSIGLICNLVEGMPLGVELASAWMDILSPIEIASEIQRSLDFLAVDLGDAPKRHQSIRALFDYTWNMLSEIEQNILKKISVFRGGFTKEAAREVAGASHKHLLGFVNKSLLNRDSTDRLGIHELLRQFAAEKLDVTKAEKVNACDLHCEYYAHFLHEREAVIDGGDTKDAIEEMDNILIAWNWAVQRQKLPEIRKQMHSFIVLHDFQGWYSQGEGAFIRLVEELETEDAKSEQGILFGLALVYLGFFTVRVGRYLTGMDLIREGQSILRQARAKKELAWANGLIAFFSRKGNYAEAEKYLLESLEYFDDVDNSWEKSYVLNNLGVLNLRKANYVEAEKYYREGLNIGKALNNRRTIAWSNFGLGIIARERGDFIEAKKFFNMSYQNHHSIGYKKMAGRALIWLGDILVLNAEYEEAIVTFQKARDIQEEIGDQENIAYAIYGLGDVAFATGEYPKAEKHFEEALAIFREEEDQKRSAIGGLLDELGRVAVAVGDDQEAQTKFLEALEIGIHNHNEQSCMSVLEGLSKLLAARGELTRAVEFAAIAANHPKANILTREEAKKHLEKLAEDLPNEIFIAAQERGKTLDLWDTVEGIRTELKGEIGT
jgi:tetratricopeptide (TPR) repeat protein